MAEIPNSADAAQKPAEETGAADGKAGITRLFSLKVVMNLQDSLDFDRCYFWTVPSRGVWILQVTTATLIGIGVILAAWVGHRFPMFWFVLGICGYYSFGSTLLRRLSIRWYYWRKSEEVPPIIATFTPKDITCEDDATSSRCQWDRVGLIGASPRGVMLVLAPNQAWFWLPQRVFEGNHYREMILAHAAHRGITIQHVR